MSTHAPLRKRVEAFCSRFGIALDDERRAMVQTLDEAGLGALLREPYARRDWP